MSEHTTLRSEFRRVSLMQENSLARANFSWAWSKIPKFSRDPRHRLLVEFGETVIILSLEPTLLGHDDGFEPQIQLIKCLSRHGIIWVKNSALTPF